MKLINSNLSEDNNENGSIEFQLNGYYYHIGELDDTHWISRQTMDDYINNRDNWEMVGKWIPEKQ